MYRLRCASLELNHVFFARRNAWSDLSSFHWVHQSCFVRSTRLNTRAVHLPAVSLCFFSTRTLSATEPDSTISVTSETVDHPQKRLQKQGKKQRKSARLPLPPDPRLRRQRDFEALFDQLAPSHSFVKLRQVMKKIRLPMRDASIRPLSLALRNILQSTPPNDSFLKATLSYLLSIDPGAPYEQPRHSPVHEVSQLLLRARERAWAESLSWSDGGAKPTFGSPEASEEEALKVVEHLHANLPPKYLSSFVDFLKAYSGKSSSLSVAEEVTKARKARKARESLYQVRYFSSPLNRAIGSHYHLVAPMIADFLGYDSQMLETDAKFVNSHEKWKLSREKFTALLLSVQERLFCDEHKPSTVHSTTDVDAADIDIASLHPSEPVQSSALNQVDRRFRKPIHVVLEAMRLHITSKSMSDPPGNEANRQVVRPDTTVFLDNVPIDVSAETIEELYTRCGKLASIQIFNKRPDLDPGPLSKAQRIARSRSQVLTSSRFKKWQRPRSPVYALLVFQGKEGYESCTHDALRIFGMLIQKHPVRTIPACQMTRLFLEGLDSVTCLDLEYLLREQLGPELFVRLDRGQNNRMVGSCEIRFPSFEDAFEAYGKLRDSFSMDSHKEVTVHWMRTPKDAALWWSRKRGFD